MSQGFFAYIRVSTVKQGTHGVSLQEQRAAIEAYAKTHRIHIVQWFEEQETAAKRGRPIFGQMISLLKKSKAPGVIIHKIDRSARNLRDWADLGELIDSGVVVHFANENLDLQSRGGRLTADLQAVVAADFIRNLREETKKGIKGRLKQGLYPMAAPIGYLDTGRGKVKEIDHIQGPLIKEAYERYATGTYSIKELGCVMYERGMLNKRGNRISKNGMGNVLRNSFYYGVISLKKSDEVYLGKHTAIVSKALYDQVARVRSFKTNCKRAKHSFLFQKLLKCGFCNYTLVGERQKGNVYYRCHTSGCPTKTIRENKLESVVADLLKTIRHSKQLQRPVDNHTHGTKTIYMRGTVRQKRDLIISHIDTITIRVTQVLPRLQSSLYPSGLLQAN